MLGGLVLLVAGVAVGAFAAGAVGQTHRASRRLRQPSGRRHPRPHQRRRPPRRRHQRPPRHQRRRRRPVPVGADRRMIGERASQRHPIAVMIDDLSPARPQSGLQSASIVRHALAEAASRATWRSSRTRCPRMSGRCAAPGCTSSSGLRNGRRSMSTPAVAAGAGDPCGEGLRPAGLQRRRVPLFAYFRRVSDRFAPHNLYFDLANLRKLSAAVGAEPGPLEQKWKFAPTSSSSSGHRAARSRSRTRRTRSPTATTGRRTRTAERSASKASNATPRTASESRRRTWSSCLSISRRSTMARARTARRPTSSAAGRGSRRTARRSRAPGRRTSRTA